MRLLCSVLCDVHNGAIVLSGYLADQVLRWGASRTKVRAGLQRLDSYAHRSGTHRFR
jgi:hypothetical protein